MDKATRLAKEIGNKLRRRKWTLAVAESCSGGLLGDKITNIPGSSDYFVGGVIAYADAVKRRLLGVSAAVLQKHGAVSALVAELMARGVRRILDARIAVATTGIAGPTGGTKAKPVGLVYFAVTDGRRTAVEQKRFSGNRLAIKRKTAQHALEMLKNVLG